MGEDTRELIKATARELHYVVSPEASRLSRGSTGRVAVVVPRIHVWFYAAMVSALERTFRDHGIDVLVYQVDGEQQRLRFFRELPARRKVDAVVLVALPVLTDEAERLDIMGAEVVVADAVVKGAAGALDAEDAYRILRAAALDEVAPPGGRGGRREIESYLATGWLPATVDGSVSKTVEFAQDTSWYCTLTSSSLPSRSQASQ